MEERTAVLLLMVLLMVSSDSGNYSVSATNYHEFRSNSGNNPNTYKFVWKTRYTGTTIQDHLDFIKSSAAN